MTIRKSAVSGLFYPNNSKELLECFDAFDAQSKNKVLNSPQVNAMISPHAGYSYSGFTANEAYRSLKGRKFKRCIVIGPSHKISFDGISVALFDEMQTPLGNIGIDLPYSNELKNSFSEIHFNPNAHEEHSTETQMPFIKHYFPDSLVVEMVYGNTTYLKLHKIISYLMLQSENLVIISSDLSHFYSQEDANYLDSIFLHAVENLQIEKLDSGCEACGMIGVKALCLYAANENMQAQILDYRTSMAASGDASRVVGYTSVLIGK